MSKSDAGHYLDKNKTILYTANNLYKEALEGFNNTNTLKEQQGLTPLAMAGYITARSQLIKALLFGKIDACAGLALFNQTGIGGSTSPYNQKLFLTIGSKFGHPACIQALKNLQNNNYDVEKEANIWVNHINTYKRDLDKEITTQELAASQVFLKNDLTKNAINLDAYNAHINITRSESEVAENFVPPPPQTKPAANYYDPHHNKTTTTTTNDNHYTPPPPERQKLDKTKVKVLGDHTCDIL